MDGSGGGCLWGSPNASPATAAGASPPATGNGACAVDEDGFALFGADDGCGDDDVDAGHGALGFGDDDGDDGDGDAPEVICQRSRRMRSYYDVYACSRREREVYICWRKKEKLRIFGVVLVLNEILVIHKGMMYPVTRIHAYVHLCMCRVCLRSRRGLPARKAWWGGSPHLSRLPWWATAGAWHGRAQVSGSILHVPRQPQPLMPWQSGRQ